MHRSVRQTPRHRALRRPRQRIAKARAAAFAIMTRRLEAIRPELRERRMYQNVDANALRKAAFALIRVFATVPRPVVGELDGFRAEPCSSILSLDHLASDRNAGRTRRKLNVHYHRQAIRCRSCHGHRSRFVVIVFLFHRNWNRISSGRIGWRRFPRSSVGDHSDRGPRNLRLTIGRGI